MQKNDYFFAAYQQGRLDPVEYLQFALGVLSQFSIAQLNEWRARFIDTIIRPHIKPAAQALVKQHQDAGDYCLIVTATNRFVTEPIAEIFGVELIAAEPEFNEAGQITGQLKGIPTYGIGKVTHTKEWLLHKGWRLEQFVESFFYSDSANDLPLLSLVSNPIATNPSARLEEHAKQQGWPIMRLFET